MNRDIIADVELSVGGRWRRIYLPPARWAGKRFELTGGREEDKSASSHHSVGAIRVRSLRPDIQRLQLQPLIRSALRAGLQWTLRQTYLFPWWSPCITVCNQFTCNFSPKNALL